jgi:hypothetical protein
MKMKTIAMVKYPRELVWRTVRDRMPEIVRLLDDIESVTSTSRELAREGTLQIVNIWRARPELPAVVRSRLDAKMLAWTDRSSWSAKKFECKWRIEPHFFADRVKSEGITRYEPAMGGRGTRVTFEGVLELSALDLPGVPVVFEGAVLAGVETFLGVLIPKNFRKLIDATAKVLERNGN